VPRPQKAALPRPADQPLLDLRPGLAGVTVGGEKVGGRLSPAGLFFGVQGCHRQIEQLGDTVTRPGRARRGHPALRRPQRHPLSARPDQALEPGAAIPTGCDQDIAPAKAERLGVGQRSRRDITRPLPAGPPDDDAAHAANRPGSARARVAEEPLLYTAEQAAALLQVCPSWLRRKAAARAVPCRFVGKHLRFSRADIETIAEGDTP
jgi:hypothetical protein